MESLPVSPHPDNAGANSAADHVTMLADAIDQLPAEWVAGHDTGDDARRRDTSPVGACRCGGASHRFTQECADHNIEFSFGHGTDHRIAHNICMMSTGCWRPPHPGAQLSLFDTVDGNRHTAFLTNQASAYICSLTLQQRQRSSAKNEIRDAKA